MKKVIFTIVFLVAVATPLFLLISWNNRKESQVCFQGNCFKVELALTRQAQGQGLMFRNNLNQGEGMLFVFEEEKEYPFWMKNTLIPLDIIWIDGQKTVVFMEKNAQPCQEKCEAITPDKKAKYVLETKGGAADQIGLNIGDKLIFDVK